MTTAQAETHLPGCECGSFSDSYKDITGHRPRGDRLEWTCAQVKAWHDENYVLDADGRTWRPRYGFHE